jgi:UDP-N-acetyl-D-galactosamine dehydrogenase
MNQEIKICLVGLGYVGLPLACLLSQKYQVSGFDVNQDKIAELKSGHDRTGEVGDRLKDCRVNFSDDPKVVGRCNFIIVAVPTPIDDDKNPDLSLVEKASQLVGENLQAGSIVVYESTVYPGCTEELCVPILERASGFKYNRDFFVGYSPERVNPGDREHTIDKIVKIVSGSTPETLERVAEVYGSVITAGIHRAPDIKTAEAAKVIENIQRDLNIALANELALIFERLDIDTKEVMEAAGTKWNFVKYQPGLVGGHCISVDPYYLTYKAAQAGYKPQVILAGRGVNDYMSHHLAQKIIKSLSEVGKALAGAKVLILGLTFKEDVPDLRNSKIREVIGELKEQGLEVYGHEPLVKDSFIEDYFGLKNSRLEDVPKTDAVIVFSPHRVFKELTLPKLKNLMKENPILFDLKRFYDKKEAEESGIVYKHL